MVNYPTKEITIEAPGIVTINSEELRAKGIEVRQFEIELEQHRWLKGGLIIGVIIIIMIAVRLLLTPPEVPTLPSSPTAVAATSLSDSQVVLRWQQPDGAKEIEVKRGNNPEHLETITKEPYNKVQQENGQYVYKDQDLSPNTRYWYALVAWNKSGPSEQTTPIDVLTLPSPPMAFTAFPDVGQVRLQWRHSGGADEFHLYRSLDETISENERIGTINGNPSDRAEREYTYIDSGLEPNTTYWYAVAAYNKSGESEKLSRSVTTPPVIIPTVVAHIEIGQVVNNQWGEIPPNANGEKHVTRQVDTSIKFRVIARDADGNEIALPSTPTWTGNWLTPANGDRIFTAPQIVPQNQPIRVTATVDGIEDYVLIKVVPGPPKSIEIVQVVDNKQEPLSKNTNGKKHVTLQVGQSIQFRVIAKDAYGNETKLTAAPTWTEANNIFTGPKIVPQKQIRITVNIEGIPPDQVLITVKGEGNIIAVARANGIEATVMVPHFVLTNAIENADVTVQRPRRDYRISPFSLVTEKGKVAAEGEVDSCRWWWNRENNQLELLILEAKKGEFVTVKVKKGPAKVWSKAIQINDKNQPSETIKW